MSIVFERRPLMSGRSTSFSSSIFLALDPHFARCCIGKCGYVLLAPGMQLRRPHRREAPEWSSNRVRRARRVCASRAMSIRGRVGIAKGHPPQCVPTSSRWLAHGKRESLSGVVARY